MSKYDYDVLVIGGGIGGFASALTANALGKVHNAIHAYPTYSEAVIKRMADLNYIETMRANPFARIGIEDTARLPGQPWVNK